MPTLTPNPPYFTLGLNHYDGQPLRVADSLTEARALAEDRAAARETFAQTMREQNEKARAALRAKAAERAAQAKPPAVTQAEPPAEPPATTAQAQKATERRTRAYKLKGRNTREAALFVATELTSLGHFKALPDAMQALARKVSESVPLPDAAPEHILSAWLDMAPPTTEKK